MEQISDSFSFCPLTAVITSILRWGGHKSGEPEVENECEGLPRLSRMNGRNCYGAGRGGSGSELGWEYCV